MNPWWAEALSVSVTGTFANGTLFNLVAGSDTGAEITYDTTGITVNYTGAGISFTGSSITGDTVTYSVTLDSEEIGVSGTVSFTSVSSFNVEKTLSHITSDTIAARSCTLLLHQRCRKLRASLAPCLLVECSPRCRCCCRCYIRRWHSHVIRRWCWISRQELG